MVKLKVKVIFMKGGWWWLAAKKMVGKSMRRLNFTRGGQPNFQTVTKIRHIDGASGHRHSPYLSYFTLICTIKGSTNFIYKLKMIEMLEK